MKTYPFRHQHHRLAIFLIVGILWGLMTGNASGERIKDVIEIKGIRSNPLSGTGLVIGLAGTGDKSLLSQQMLTNILRDSGLVLSPTSIKGGNIAVVIVTAELGAFAREGTRFDVNVAAIGDAESLHNGILLATPLRGLDQQVYAVAQGAVSLAGWTVAGQQSSTSKNHQTVARIPDGAIVEKEEIAEYIELLGGKRVITLSLRNEDFMTATRISDAVNQIYPETAIVLDGRAIRVTVPDHVQPSQIAQFVVAINSQTVTVDNTASVVINERTGTIVVGENVTIASAAIAQGSLTVSVNESAQVSQPTAPFSNAGETVVVDETTVSADEPDAALVPIPRLVTVAELAQALNGIGATPSDLIAIFSALKRQGALQAKLIIM
jgi:flagellar P-ring protein FlgI